MNVLVEAKPRPEAAKPPARRRLPRWREAEEYFRQHRDPKLKVTLPRLRFLEEPAA